LKSIGVSSKSPTDYRLCLNHFSIGGPTKFEIPTKFEPVDAFIPPQEKAKLKVLEAAFSAIPQNQRSTLLNVVVSSNSALPEASLQPPTSSPSPTATIPDSTISYEK